MMDLLNFPKSQYNYCSPIGLHDHVDPLFREIVETAAFKRLQDIRFLGGIDYVIVSSPNGALSNKRYTRYQHSLGVGKLALHYAKLRELNEYQSRLAFAAALLHDIGHAPLSHSLEPVFQEAFNLNHHDATKIVIKGEIQLGKEVTNILKSNRIDPDQVIDIIEGNEDPFEGFFSGPINFDTIEAILRSRRYIRPKAVIQSPIDVVQAATLRISNTDCQIVDRFWDYKQQVYKHIIRSREGVVADYLCQKAARKELHRLSKKDFFATETKLFRRLPRIRRTLHSVLTDENRALGGVPLIYKARNFFIDTSTSFFNRSDKERYKQTKIERHLFPLFEYPQSQEEES